MAFNNNYNLEILNDINNVYFTGINNVTSNLQNENVSKDKKWYKSDITNNKLNMQKQSWIRGFNQGYSGIGNHSAGKYSGICIQNPVQYI